MRSSIVKLGESSLKDNRKSLFHLKDSELHTKFDEEIETKLVSVIRNKIGKEFGIVAEEKAHGGNSEEFIFFIDPIDGTKNFVNGNPLWSISIGLWDVNLSQPLLGIVFNPSSNELFEWSYDQKANLNGRSIEPATVSDLSKSIVGVNFLRDKKKFDSNWDRMSYHYKKLAKYVYGFRMIQSDSLSLCWTASGKLDGCYLVGTRNFDFAGGLAICLGAGLKCTDISDFGSGKIDLNRSNYNLLISNSNLLDELKEFIPR